MKLKRKSYSKHNTVSKVPKKKDSRWKSRTLAVLLPGAYQAKEAAKYAYNSEEEYKKNRGKYALKGAFTPITATLVKKKVEKMTKNGASKKNIRDYLENYGNKKHWRYGLAEAGAYAVGAPALGVPVAYAVGLYDKIANNRSEFDKN